MFKTLIYVRKNGTEPELSALRHIVEDRGDIVAGVFRDDPTITGRGKYAGWREMIGRLDQADQVVVVSAADLPGRTVGDLLNILSVLSEHGVALRLHREGINTDDGAAAIIALTTAYRGAKLSEAIRSGQARARAAGKRLGRPAVPDHVRQRITDDLANGLGVRAVGRKHNVSPGTCINVRRSMQVSPQRQAA